MREIKWRFKHLSLLLTIAAFTSGLNTHDAAAQTAAAPSPAIGHAAPNFSRMDLNHRKIELAAYRGKVVLLNFWATWCGPCLTEMPRFVEWQKQYGSQRFQVVGISMDDKSPPVRTAYSRLQLNYPVVMGDERLGAAYGGILGLPVTYLIDGGGRIRARYQGDADLKSIESEISRLLPSH
jgi:cytochrome c biogenesis protein CcmG, thiol:disulfide interchange protein DsbE